MVIGLLFLFSATGCRLLPWGWFRHTEKGLASWYGNEHHGKRTASGEVFNQWAMTAAHKKLPFDTIIRVVNRKNGRTVKVRINDRGPFVRGRIIDLSKGAAQRIGMIRDGVVPVRVKVLKRGRYRSRWRFGFHLPPCRCFSPVFPTN